MALVVATVFVGCSSSDIASPGDWKKGLDKEVIEALSQLSAEDRAAALKQKVCPVTDEQLGSMDKPHKINIEGTDVFLCCSGCEGDLREDPAKYLKKLKAD